MNDFTKEELQTILEALTIIDADPSIKPEIYWPDSLRYKIQSMINNYREAPCNTKKIATSHLKEATSLISHAMCLLGLEDE